MVPAGHTFDRRVAAALLLIALVPLTRAADVAKPAVTTAAPVVIPHALNRTLDEKARKAERKTAARVENPDLPLLNPGLQPVRWPSNTDTLRANLLTPQVKGTPVFGWIAENLYRDKADNGWCVQLDGGEYVVLYRYHPKR